MLDSFLYDPSIIADSIKRIAKGKDISLKEVLSDIGLGANTFSNMRHGRMPSAESLAKIADYLGCSVDYLLGRTDIPTVVEAGTPFLQSEEYPVIAKYRALSEPGKAIVERLMDDVFTSDVLKKNTPTALCDERIDTILQNDGELQQLFQTMSQLKTESIEEIIRFVRFQKSLQEPVDE